MKSNPTISVIIPVYNTEDFIGEAIESAATQTIKPLEIIIIDDGSTDNSSKIIAKYLSKNIVSFYQKNSGPASARNAGIKIARGDFIAFLDADDLWAENTLAMHYAHFKEQPNLDIARGYTRLIKKNNNLLKKYEKYEEYDLPKFFISFVTGLFKKSVFEKVGLLDEELYYREDIDWFLKAKELNIQIKTYENIVHYCRIHPNKITFSPEKKTDLTCLFKMIRNYRARQKLSRLSKDSK